MSLYVRGIFIHTEKLLGKQLEALKKSEKMKQAVFGRLKSFLKESLIGQLGIDDYTVVGYRRTGLVCFAEAPILKYYE